ncbi:hypothetical protein B0T11DRAFT_324940 [Plectosphaerella cucumerina]|uniref:Uncharacterized protein n=1 Tax=Plectosphaerella cucumerina TaxID=40658 RepID=A0A8K0TWI2_9PEZI|nr:hypothetical protein B0T11DRAFT_324940 [Plectosphaerella cucumerina]
MARPRQPDFDLSFFSSSCAIASQLSITPTVDQNIVSILGISEDRPRLHARAVINTIAAVHDRSNGSALEYAAQLQALLDGNDSGYGGSSNDNNHAASLARDYATQPDIHNHSQASAIHQLWYDQHRSNLGRSVSRVVELLKELQEINTRWPAHYPSVLRIGSAPTLPSRPGMQHTYSVPSSLSSNKQTLPALPVPSRDQNKARSYHDLISISTEKGLK